MSARLRQYLQDAYVGHPEMAQLRSSRNAPIQIDDQDDNDPIEDFCTIFVTIGKRRTFEIELAGRMPITEAMADLAEIYGGFADRTGGRIMLKLNPDQVDTLIDLARKIKATTGMGPSAGNPNWDRICARTISSLRRFVRVVKDYQKSRLKGIA